MLAMRPPFYHTLFFYGLRYLCREGGRLGIGYLWAKLVCNAHIRVWLLYLLFYLQYFAPILLFFPKLS